MSKTVYIHVPFCPKVCNYCDFAVLKASESLHRKWWQGIVTEIDLKYGQKPNGGLELKPPHLYTNSARVSLDTLYFGGGTPSILGVDLWREILETCHEIWDLDKLREWTIEVNPESLTQEKLDLWKSFGVNRISMGVQSFQDEMLTLLGRDYQVRVLEKSLNLLASSGWNFSLDLMFSLPGQSMENFLSDLKRVISYKPNHVSFYGLTIEENTLFDQWNKKGKLAKPLDDVNQMYHQGVELLASYGYNRYEISNFALEGFESKHNSKYWNLEDYEGLGPGAHSFDGNTRKWNYRHLNKWLKSLEAQGFEESETLTEVQKFNESIWLGLRQSKGVRLQQKFGNTTIENLLSPKMKLMESLIQQKQLEIQNGYLKIVGEGWNLIDEISIKLFE